jgi:small-conductance mechanosensitive channel
LAAGTDLATDTGQATDTSLYILKNAKPFLAPKTNPYLAADTSPYPAADTNLHLAKDTTTTTATPDTPWPMGKVEDKITNRPTEALDMISFPNFFWAIVFIIIGYYFIKLLITILNLFAERSARFRITIKSIIPIIRIVIWTLVIFVIIKGIFNPPMETVIAVSASIGIAVGLAASDLVKNAFGGITILFDRPFQVGDKINVGNYYGEVLEIGLRITKLVTADDSIVSVPNAELMNNSISNSNSGELNCQVVAEIYLPIDVDTSKARKIALEAAQVSKFVYLKKPIVVLFFNEMKERRSYLKMRLKAYVMDIRYEFQFKSDMTEIVIRELLKQEVIKKDELF